MAFTRSLILAVCSVAVTACDPIDGVGETNTPVTRFVTLTNNGIMPDQNFQEDGGAGSHSDLVLYEGKLVGYSYAYGLVADSDTFLGVAGATPDPYVGAEIESGSVSYNARYSLAHADVDSTTNAAGNIQLTAGFDSGRVTGEDSGLQVYGEFSGTTLGGTVVHDGIVAELRGSVGTSAIAGAFVGNSDEEVLVGGFVGVNN